MSKSRDNDPDFRGHLHVPRDKVLLEDLKRIDGMSEELALRVYRSIVGRKLSVFGWLQDPPADDPDAQFGIVTSARPWREHYN